MKVDLMVHSTINFLSAISLAIGEIRFLTETFKKINQQGFLY